MLSLTARHIRDICKMRVWKEEVPRSLIILQGKRPEQGGRTSSFTGKLCVVLTVVGVGSAIGGCGLEDLL